MNYYQQEVVRITNQLFPEAYLCKYIIQARHYIHANYAKRISMEELAKQSHFSKFHFLRLFKKIYGRTPYQYLTEVRIEHAKKLLKQGRSVLEASEAVGFESPTAFTSVFKRVTGSSPKSVKKKSAQIEKQY